MNNKSQSPILYESNAIKQTHPLHLYHLAKAFKLSPKEPNNARVLELACASGGNLLPMAYYLQSHFVGIDISEQEIALALDASLMLNLKNIEFKAQSVVDFKASQPFDYIICHGLYSWVAPPVRESILKICQQYLSDDGIAYISYNTYPGWVIGNSLRDLLLLSAKSQSSINNKLTQVHALMKSLSIGLSQPQSAYEWLLNEEVKLVSAHSDNQLLHEHLGNAHFPCYFYEFLESVQRYQLHYLCDATFFEFEDASFEPHYSQLQDLMHNRRFRSSLLSKKSVNKANVQNMKAAYGSLASQICPNPVVPPKPQASLLARFQVSQQPHVTNIHHENILLTPIAQAIFPFLDGQHDFESLKSIVKQYIDAGELVLVDSLQQSILDPSHQENQLNVILQETLLLLATRYLIHV
ncbi:MAG: methyltransferase domain-containing protein [Candidatus Berkiella sp.]